MNRSKNIIILSGKSSGSSACLALLSKFAAIRHVEKTRHFEHETLYWVKAASILGRPQIKLADSEVPIKSRTARKDLVKLLSDNLDGYLAPSDDSELIFNGWKSLCLKYAPVFIEKSPHHLYQRSALELIVECMERLTEVDFLLIGLVRNPMDVIYSAFMRWKTPPEILEREWITAYKNLNKLKRRLGPKLAIIRYEDMVTSLDSLEPVFNFCHLRMQDADHHHFHKQSIHRWKKDKFYGFNLSDDGLKLADFYGYDVKELLNTQERLWPCYKIALRGVHKSLFPFRRFLVSVRDRWIAQDRSSQ